MESVRFDIAKEIEEGEILSLLNRSFQSIARSEGPERGKHFWKWKYQDSPFGQATVQYARVNSQLAVVGCLWPAMFEYRGRSLNALQPCDTAVDYRFRRHGLFGALNKARLDVAKDLDFDLIFNFPNENSLPGYIKSGWKLLGKVPWLVRPMKPLSIFRDHFSPSKSINQSLPAAFQLVEKKEEEFEDLSCGKNNLLSLVRPPGYWNWRFSLHPTREYGVIRTEKWKHTFAVFTLSKKQSGLIEMVVVEFIACAASVSELLSEILKCARKVNAAFVAMMNPHSLPRHFFLQKGFLPITDKNLVFYPLRNDLPEQLQDIRNWNFQAALHDSI